MPKAHALLAGSGVGTPAVRTFLDLDSTSDGGALLHALWLGVFKGKTSAWKTKRALGTTE